MYREFQPSASLARYVECYWESAGGSGLRRILPDGCVDILARRSRGNLEQVEVVGLMTQAHLVPVRPETSFFGIRFRPAMASAFLKGVQELADRTEPLTSFLPRHRVEAFTDRMATISANRGAADQFLQAIDPAFSSWDNTWSSRQQRRVCLDRSGVSTKYLSRILRFRRAWEYLQTARPLGGADCAVLLGYYDQAHMIREFREFSALTPGQFIQSLDPPSVVASAHA